MHRFRKFALVVTTLLAFLLTACLAPAPAPAAQPQPQTASTESAEVPATQADLVGPTWQWLSWVQTLPASQSVIPEPEKYTITFMESGAVNVQADCNQVVGTYIAQNGNLLIDLGPSTMAFCGEQSIDQQFVALIAQVDGATLVNNGQLRLSLSQNAGYLDFGTGGAGDTAGLEITPQQIHLDTQGLPYSWHASVVAATPYDASQPPGPMGLPEHIVINFGVTNPADKKPGDPIMYIIPVDAYTDLWAQAGNDAVAQAIDAIFKLTVVLPIPAPVSGLPALPYEEVSGVNDLATQVGRAQFGETSATKNGFRYVGRWAQSANPVINGDLQYLSQGFTNDGRYLVIFYYPVTTATLPNSAAEVPAQEMQLSQANPAAYAEAKAETLNSVPPDEWMPDLTTLDRVVGSLQIDGMTANGLRGNTWRPVASTSEPSGEETPIDQPEEYAVIYYPDFNLDYITDCNGGTGTYTNSGGMTGSIQTNLGAATLPNCGPGSYADGFVGTLMAAQDYKLLPGGQGMELIRPAGGGSLIFELVPPAVSVPPPTNPTPPLPTPAPTQAPTPVPPVVWPTPAPQVPTGIVIAPDGVNVRYGPGTNYPVIGFAAFGQTGVIAGRSADSQWWAFVAPAAPNGLAWVAAEYIEATNAQNVPVLPAPPLPTQPTATPPPVVAQPIATPPPVIAQPIATPPAAAPVIEFNANPETIAAGECTTLSWNVQNVSAVWVYPSGADYSDYPVAGLDSRQECPLETTSYEIRVALYTDAIQFLGVTVEVQDNDPLASTEWLLVSMLGQSLVPDSAVTLIFGDDNDVSGNGGCNQYNGVYTASASTLQISGVISTGTLCGPEIDGQEQAYLALLPQAGSYAVQGGQLIIRDLNGNEILSYTAQ